MSKRPRGASSVDEITSSHPSKVTKSITSIFESPDQKFILIEGAPGIGKTVLAKEITYRWACGEMLQGKKLFLLFVRDPNLHSVDSINQQLISYFSCDYLSDSEVDVAVDELKKSRGQNIVFVIDGFDECPHHCQLNLFIEKLAKHEIFPKSIVVITSRPHASILLRPLVDQRIEVLGFAKEEREKYIAESFKEFSDKRTELKKYLKLQPIINSIMHVPLHLAVLLYLYKEDSLPDTLTELNEQFIIHTIYRHLEKHHLLSHLPYDKNIKIVKDLPKPIIELVNQLSELAMKGLKERQTVFTYDEVKTVCTDIDDFPNGFGLLQAVCKRAMKGAGYTVSFNFLHSTMQEFLAAYYVSTLPNKEQSLCMAYHFDVGDYVWLMYVGIVGIESDGFNWYQSTLKLKKPLLARNLLIFQCYLEARKVVQVPESISVTFEDGNIEMGHTKIDPYTMVSLVNVIAKSCVHLRSLNLPSCSITDEEMTILQGLFTDYKENICNMEHICLSENYISSLWGIDSSSTTTEKSKSGMLLVPCLNLFSNQLKDIGIFELFNSLHYNTSLLQLDISHNGITRSGAVAISECLKNNNTLQVLNISHNELLDDGVIAISDSLKTNCTLKTLSMADNRITNKGTANIANAIAFNKTLSDLNISANCITKEGIMDILIAGTKMRALQKLDCKFNALSQSDVVDLVKYNRHKNVVQVFNTSWNKITGDTDSGLNTITYEDGHCTTLPYNQSYNINDVVFCCIKDSYLEELYLEGSKMSQYLTIIAKAIQVNKALTKMHIMGFSIYNRVQAINDCLKVNTLKELTVSSYCNFNCGALLNIIETVVYNTTLKKLDISNNIISTDDVESIGVCLKHNETLQELIMEYATITDSGALMIAEAIKVNTTLLVLNISYNKITDVGILAISDSLKYNKRLRELNINHNGFTRNSILKFAEFLKTNTTLVKLFAERSYVLIKPSDVIDLLKSNNTLRQIKIGHFDWSHHINVEDTEYMEWIMSTTEHNCVFLQTVTLNLNRRIFVAFKEDSNNAIKVTNYLINNKVLQTLDLYGCNFTNIELKLHGSVHYCDDNKKSECPQNLHDHHEDHTEIMKMIESIKVSTTLHTLIINNYLIQDEGAEIICDCIAHNTSIRELDLSRNSITSKEAVKIFKAIEVNKVIQKLDISHNEICDDGALAISECLNSSTTLHHLNVEYNDMCHEGIMVIIDSLKNNTALLGLHMDIIYTTADKLAAMLKVNSTLRSLSIKNVTSKRQVDTFSFNRTILLAMYDNSSVTLLELPVEIDRERCVLQNEVENINIERRIQATPTIDVYFDFPTLPFRQCLCPFVDSDCETFDFL